MAAIKIVWVCKQTGDITTTPEGKAPKANSMQENFGHDWIPVKVISQ